MNLFSRPPAGLLSDVVAQRWGMRGRLWALWACQTMGGLLCLGMGFASGSLAATLAMMITFSIFCQASCGLAFGIVPFVSKRAGGLVAGFVGSGGNVGGAVTQAIFFTCLPITTQDGFKWMGVMIVGMTLLYTAVYFPMWGGMLSGPRQGATEEDYYMFEWTAEEIVQSLHTDSLKFAYEARSQRGQSKHKLIDSIKAVITMTEVNGGDDAKMSPTLTASHV
eukprot:gene6420-6651_t